AITYDRSYGEEAVDPSFAPVIDGTVLAVAVDHEGRTLVGGDFTSVDGVARRNLARLFADGSVDPTFDPSPSGAVHAIAVDRMHRILIGGDFSSVRGVPTSRIARLAPEGHPDPAFRPEPDGTVRAVAVETDGNLLVGGSFTTIADTPRNRIARLTPTGDADPDFDPGADGTVRAIAREPDGDLLVGGSFTTIAGTPRSHIARLTPTGDADPGFAPAVGGPVHAVAVKADGRILVGGSFATVAGTPRSRIARLTPTGTVDPDFDPGAGNPVSALVVQVDGRILVGGPFISIAGTPRAGLARLGGFTGYPAPLTVRVTDRAGSATATLVLGVETRPPAEPITIRTTAGPAPGSLVITWTPPADTGSGPVTDYVVEYRPVGATGWTTFPDGVSTDPTVVVPDLPTDIGYEFRIIAVNVGGAGPPAASGPDVTRPGPPAVPGAPGTPTAIAAPGSVTLTWRAPSVDGGSPVTDYVVERRAVPSGSWAVVVDGVGTATTAVVGGLGPGEASEFRIAAVNAVGVGAWSGSASATTPTAPSVPGGLTATPGDGQLALTWSAPTDTGGADLLDHAIEYRTAPAGAWTSFADDVSPGTGATITGLANGTAYEVRVAAVNGVGASAWTAPVTATPRTVPGAPGTPATAPNEGRVTLTWTAPSESGGAPVTDYVIEHRTLPLGSWTVFADTVTTGTTVSVTGLVNGTAYELRVAAVNEAGAGAWSSIVSATPRTTASAPGTPVATVGNAQLQLGWTAPSSDGGAAITDYTVEYRAVGETVWVELADGVNPTPGAVVSGLTNGTAYEARVAARNAAGAGAWSPVVTATPLAVPDAPTALTATPGDGQMVLGWTAGADNGGAITDYLVEIRTGGGSWSTFADGTTATTGATVTGLTNGTTYELRVAAVNAAGTGPWAGPVSTAPRTTPTAPTAVAATPDDAAIDLSWAVPASDGGAAVTDYQVRFRPIGNVTWTTVDDGTSTATTLTVSGLDNGTGYELEVRAVNAAGAGPWAGPATATPRTTPGSPGALTATPDNGQVALGWSAPAADGGAAVTDYVIEYRTLPSGSWTVFPDVVGTGTSATITGLVNGTGHAFRVSAVNAAGAGTPAGPVDATPRTVADAPGAPSVTPGDGELAVSWSAPAADGGAAITDYALEYRTLPSGSWTAVADGVSAATDRTLTGLTTGTAYEVRVAAVNAAGTGAWSGAAAGTPRRSAGAPTGLSATPGNTIVVLAWTAPGSDGGSPLTDYAVEYRELPSGSWTGFADGSSATTGVTVAGLANGTTYELRVAAVNAAGSPRSISPGPLQRTAAPPSPTTRSNTGRSPPVPGPPTPTPSPPARASRSPASPTAPPTSSASPPSTPPAPARGPRPPRRHRARPPPRRPRSRPRPATPPSPSPGSRRDPTAATPSPTTRSSTAPCPPVRGPPSPTAQGRRRAPRSPGSPMAPPTNCASPPSTPAAPAGGATPRRQRPAPPRSHPPRSPRPRRTMRSSSPGALPDRTAAPPSPITRSSTGRSRPVAGPCSPMPSPPAPASPSPASPTAPPTNCASPPSTPPASAPGPHRPPGPRGRSPASPVRSPPLRATPPSPSPGPHPPPTAAAPSPTTPSSSASPGRRRGRSSP
ncbi:MAG: fibronectin type III domain-containing protein, partial [Acidimicrobiales bacterium]|nr:fibronectin type III domain-containing protein [Acidimicrobiales bacterium]